MGLDMYLYRQQYVSGYSFEGSDPSTYQNILAAAGITGTPESPHLTVSACVAYWRKANAIHAWFYSLDGGRDECQRIPVTLDQLRELHNLALMSLNVPAVRANPLPTQSGFFFGPTEYDEWYEQNAKSTVEQLDRILSDIPEDANPWDYEFYYQASW